MSMPSNCTNLSKIGNISKNWVVNAYEWSMLDNAVLTVTKNSKLPIIQMILKFKKIEFSNIVSVTEVMRASFNLIIKQLTGIPIHTVINCQAIEYFDSAAIGAFIAAQEKAKENNTIIVLCNIQDTIISKIKMIGAVKFVPIFDAIEDAQKYILNWIANV